MTVPVVTRPLVIPAAVVISPEVIRPVVIPGAVVIDAVVIRPVVGVLYPPSYRIKNPV